MDIKCKVILAACVLTSVLSCGKIEQRAADVVHDTWFEEDVQADTLAEEEEEELDIIEEESPALDGVFNDFLFAYLHSSRLRRERTARPLRLEHTDRPAKILEDFDPVFEFGFLSGEYFTTLYGSSQQMHADDEGELEEDSIVSLQRINLNDRTIRNFQFLRSQGRWRLDVVRESTFEDDDLCDYLNFYARFCSDSLFQIQSIADPLHVVIQGSEDEEGSIDGIIDADQWQTFCPEMPAGIISNIKKGQHYGGHRILLRKSGQSSGLQEIFTFTREKGEWRLTRYEN